MYIVELVSLLGLGFGIDLNSLQLQLVVLIRRNDLPEFQLSLFLNICPVNFFWVGLIHDYITDLKVILSINHKLTRYMYLILDLLIICTGGKL